MDLEKMAKELISKGYKVFQVEENGKKPFYKTAPEGCNSATDRPDIISKWWTEYPRQNIGVKCDNIIVLDIDVKSINGLASLQTMKEELGEIPLENNRIQTPSGGAHLYFQRPEEKITGQTNIKFNGIHTGMDIRIGNQYILAPGSTIDGKEYSGELPPVSALPKLSKRWINALPTAEPKVQTQQAQTIPSIYPQTPTLERAHKYASQIEPSISGQGGHASLMWACRAIGRGFALPLDVTKNIILKEFNPRCVPPWTEKEIDHKLETAYNEDFNKPLGWLLNEDKPINTGALPACIQTGKAETAGGETKEGQAPEDSEDENDLIDTVSQVDLPNIKKDYPDFLLYPFFRKGESVLIAAKAGVGKTWLALTMAHAIAHGCWMLDVPIWIADKPNKVLYIDGEMSLFDLQERSKLLRDPTPNLLFNNLEIIKGDYRIDLYKNEYQQKVLKTAIKKEVKVIVIDNLNALYRCPKPNEKTSWEPYDDFIIACRKRGIALIIIDHCGKASEAGAIGSSEKQNAVNHVIELEKAGRCAEGEGTRFYIKFTKSRSCSGSDIVKMLVCCKDGQVLWLNEYPSDDDSRAEQSPARKKEEPKKETPAVKKEPAEQKPAVKKEKTITQQIEDLLEQGEDVKDILKSEKFNKRTVNHVRKQWEERKQKQGEEAKSETPPAEDRPPAETAKRQ